MRRHLTSAEAANAARAALRSLRRAEPRSFTDAHGYRVTDVVAIAPRGKPATVVFLEQLWMGLPVHRGGRSIIRSGRKISVTGTHLRIRPGASVFSKVTKDEAVASATEFIVGRSKPPAGPARVTARLVVLAGKPSRLAWLVRGVLADAGYFECFVDPATLRVRGYRDWDQGVTAQLYCTDEDRFPVDVNPSWLNASQRRFIPLKGGGSEWPWPTVAAGNHDSAVPMERVAMNVVCLTNMGLRAIEGAGGKVSSLVEITMFETDASSLGKAAFSSPTCGLQALTFRPWNTRHAASDPTVVLHELTHLALCHGVGGNKSDVPFEKAGDSAAINEGIADAVGLTLWNSIRRQMAPPRNECLAVGEWLLAASMRDYAPFLAMPAHPSQWSAATGPYTQGAVLCAALLSFRKGLLPQLSESQADAVLWSAVFAAVPMLPFQGDCPYACCLTSALTKAVPAAHWPSLQWALDARGIPANCTHVKKI